ncbi:MAG TPA: ABC transporter ATP-binding protein [Archangium sp.]|nr:ABC transporter ATP-binding protein [Archangium sp.]
MQAVLVASKLSKEYSGVQALAGLELQVAPGEVLCLLGPNGAGKTTTLNLFLGLLRPTSGAAYVKGVHVEADPAAARRHLAYVPEQVRLYPHLTGLENLGYFLSLSLPESPAPQHLLELLAEAGLPAEAAHRRVGGYSKGMRQKVVIALALARGTEALLLDEPTSGLDPSSIRELGGLIQRLSARGSAVLMVTHDLAIVRSVAHRVGVMKAGHLVELAEASSLGDAALERLYWKHFEVARS